MAEEIKQTPEGKRMEQTYPPERIDAIRTAYEARFGDDIPWDTYLLPQYNILFFEQSLQQGYPFTVAQHKEFWVRMGNDPDQYDPPEGHLR